MLSKNQVAILLFAGSSLMSNCVFADPDSFSSSAAGVVVPRTVEQMLAIDAQRALINEQRLLLEEQRKGGYGRLSSNPETQMASQEGKKEAQKKPEPPVQIDLLGIFGVGNVLQADIEINGSRYRYKKGFELPVGAGDDFRFRLVNISAPCISLSDSIGAPRKVCLAKSAL
ncbi:hypothetical protein ACEN2T_18090 [Pseudomonas sp. W22_MBD1_FP4]|uniref:hypothetical protein n=1 Tax=Pseudomonas sp. W22_MBD1_FP4 TaxID=3240272 RepID=UPI003F9757F2